MATTPPFSNVSCPRCGDPIHTAFAGSNLCARCASAHILAMTLEPVGPSAPPFGPTGPKRIGPYTIISEIGHGGMGTVYLAQHHQLGRIVALKAIPSTGSASSPLEIRFLREARTVAQLRHPHIVAVHDAGRTETHAYFAMDYVENGDVAQRLRETRSFEPGFAASLMHAVAQAIAYSHGEGVLHRDLKPSNILLENDEPRVADFGLATHLASGGDLTATRTQIGTPHYLAPEVLTGTSEHGVAADIYALGVILFEMLAGRTPFAGANPSALGSLVATVDPPELRLWVPHVPRDLETICRHCREIEPSRRYPSAAALAEDLRRFLAGESIVARPVSHLTQLWRWTRRHPQLAALWTVSFLLAIGSSAAAVGLNRARIENATEVLRTAHALDAAHAAEALARDRLRDAKLAEARARRGTSESGRSSAALAALAEAAAIRPGWDLQNEAVEALMLPEFQVQETWALHPTVPVGAVVDPTGQIAVIEDLTVTGESRGAISLRRWGDEATFVQLEAANTSLAGNLRFNADGTRLITRYQDESLRVWDTHTGALLLERPGVPLAVRNSSNALQNDDHDFAADGRSLCIGAADGGLRWLSLIDGSELAHSPNGERFTTVRCAPHGERVAACSVSISAVGPHHVTVFARPGATPERVFPLASVPVAIAWSPDGRRLVVSQTDRTVTTYDVPNGRILHAFSAPSGEPRMIVVLAGGEYAAVTGIGSNAQLLNLATGHVECELGESGPVPLTGDVGGTTFFVNDPVGVVRRWQWREPVGRRHMTLPFADNYELGGDAGGLDISDDGHWAVSAHGRFAVARDLDSGAMLAELDGDAPSLLPFSSVMFDSDGASLLRCSTATGLRRHGFHTDLDGDSIAFAEPETLDSEPGFLISARTANRRRLVLINRVSGDVKVLDLDATGHAAQVSRWQTPGVNFAAISPDGSMVLLNCTGVGDDAADMRLRVHRADTGKIVATPDAAVSCDAAWSDDGATALTSNGQSESVIWNTRDWTRRATLTAGLGGNTTTFGLSPDGSYAVVCQGQLVNLVSTRDGALLRTFRVPQAPGFASAVRFLPDRQRFAVIWPDGALDLFDPAAVTAALAAHHIR